MQPWIHESELASYLQEQRHGNRSRMSVNSNVSSLAHYRQEDVMRLDQAIASLDGFYQRLASNIELSGRLAHLLEFLNQLRSDLPIHVPEGAFERLQILRSWLFWLPPAMLRPGGSDVGSMAVLSQFYAAALILEPLFPEIGPSYLATLAVSPIEEMHRSMLTRRTNQPQDAGVQVALALMEPPARASTEYRARQEFMAQRADSYRNSPRGGYAPPSVPLASSPAAGSYSPIPVTTGIATSVSPYLSPAVPHLGPRRASHFIDPSPSLRPAMYGERSSSYDAASTPYGRGYETSGMAYHDTSAFQSFSAGSGLGFVSPAQLWT